MLINKEVILIRNNLGWHSHVFLLSGISVEKDFIKRLAFKFQLFLASLLLNGLLSTLYLLIRIYHVLIFCLSFSCLICAKKPTTVNFK